MKPIIQYITVIFSIILVCTSCASIRASKECKVPAKPECICTMQYDPVCGCDGVTYGNACVAICSGVQKYTKGKCPDDKSDDKK